MITSAAGYRRYAQDLLVGHPLWRFVILTIIRYLHAALFGSDLEKIVYDLAIMLRSNSLK